MSTWAIANEEDVQKSLEITVDDVNVESGELTAQSTRRSATMRSRRILDMKMTPSTLRESHSAD